MAKRNSAAQGLLPSSAPDFGFGTSTFLALCPRLPLGEMRISMALEGKTAPHSACGAGCGHRGADTRRLLELAPGPMCINFTTRRNHHLEPTVDPFLQAGPSLCSVPTSSLMPRGPSARGSQLGRTDRAVYRRSLGRLFPHRPPEKQLAGSARFQILFAQLCCPAA